MKKVVLIGASGFIGSVILSELINRGYQVTAVVRHPEKIKMSHENLTVVQADATDTQKIKTISNGFEAVISAYNPGWTNPDIYRETLKVYGSILEGIKQAGVKRFQVVGGAGTLFCSPGVRLMDSGAIPESFLPAVKGLGEFYLEVLTQEKNIDWVFFSPAGNIAPGERTGVYRLGKDDLITDAEGKSNISVADYAKAMVDELEKREFHQERFTIGY